MITVFYSIALLILRTATRDLFDRLPFKIFYYGSLISGMLACLCLFSGSSTIIYALAGVFMAGGYGIMSSECQSSSILAADPAQSGLASSTFFIGIDLGLLLGPSIGGMVIEQAGINMFYPVLSCVIVLSLAIFIPLYKKIANIH